METELDMKITTANEQKTLSSLEVKEIVSEKIKEILEQAGIAADQEVVIKEVKGEDSNSVFRIDCGNSVYALKVFSNSAEGGQFYTNKVFDQLLIKNNIPTPEIVYASADRDLIPAPWIIWEWFGGEPSCGIESESERRNIAIQTGVQLRKIHEIETPGFGRPDSEGDWADDIQGTLDFYAGRIKNLMEKGGTAFSDEELAEILKATAESRELASFSEPRLLHGDITGGNVLVSESKEIAFIDPGEIIAGDPMSDLGYSQTTRLSPIFRDGVWEGYTKDKPLTDEEQDRFLRWRLLRQCVIACRAALNKDKNAEKYASDAKRFLEELKSK